MRVQGTSLQPEPLPIVVISVQLRVEFFFHLALLAAAVAVILLSVFMRTEGETMVFLPGSIFPLPESCAARQLFGINCPGCGLTRAFIAISRGEWARAWYFNPASFAVYLFVVAQIPWRCFQMWRIATHRFPVFSVWLFLPLVVLTASLLLQWIVVLIG